MRVVGRGDDLRFCANVFAKAFHVFADVDSLLLITESEGHTAIWNLCTFLLQLVELCLDWPLRNEIFFYLFVKQKYIWTVF